MKTTIRVGDRVQSCYRAPWFGNVIHVEKRTGIGALCTVHVTHDRRGNPQRNKNMKCKLDEAWLTVIKEAAPLSSLEPT